MIGSFGKLATRAAKCRRRDCLTLAPQYGRPPGIIHALQRDQMAAGIADRNTDPNVELFGLHVLACRFVFAATQNAQETNSLRNDSCQRVAFFDWPWIGPCLQSKETHYI